MMKLKKTAKETVAALKAHGFKAEWRVSRRSYLITGDAAILEIFTLSQTAVSSGDAMDAVWISNYADLFESEQTAEPETATTAAESAEDADQEAFEGSLPTETENAPQGDFGGFSEEPTGLTVSMPLDGFTDAALENLRKLVDGKASLISKAMGAARLTIETEGDRVSFHWWDRIPAPEETQAYTAFIAAISAFAKSARRVNVTERGEVESEKYAFRGFLLRLGFIGPECAAQRKLLLRNLSGSASFPNSQKYTAFCSAQKAKRDAAKEEIA